MINVICSKLQLSPTLASPHYKVNVALDIVYILINAVYFTLALYHTVYAIAFAISSSHTPST